MFGKSRTRLAPGLDKGFLMDAGSARVVDFDLRAHVDRTAVDVTARASEITMTCTAHAATVCSAIYHAVISVRLWGLYCSLASTC